MRELTSVNSPNPTNSCKAKQNRDFRDKEKRKEIGDKFYFPFVAVAGFVLNKGRWTQG